MDLGDYLIKNDIRFNNIVIIKLIITPRIKNNKQKKYNYYNHNGDIIIPKNITIKCIKCGNDIDFKKLSDRYITEDYCCRSCNSKGEKNSMFGKKHTNETKKHYSENRKGVNNSFYGKKHTDKLKERFSNERKGKWYIGENNTQYGANNLNILIDKYGEDKAQELWSKKYKKHSKDMEGENNPFYGKTHSDDTKKALSKSTTKYIKTLKEHGLWDDYCDKISTTLKGRVLTDEHRKKLRISAIKNIEDRSGQVIPNYNINACIILDKIMIETNTFIQHAENGGEHHIKELGYWVDGYDKENNIVYEIDEKHHFNRDGTLKNKDKKRESEIKRFLKCEIKRIKI